MMDWTQRLEERRAIFSECPGGSLPKLTEPPFVSSVSAPDGRSRNIIPAGADVYAHLLSLADTYGFNRALVNRVPTAELPLYADMSGPYLIALLDALQDDSDIDAGRVPRGWDAKAVCAHCGPVWLHPAVAALLTVKDGSPYAPLGCPWCRIRKAGKYLPRPPEPEP